MAAPSIAIRSPKAALPTTSPHLMPFHISHTGPAPVSTYFRVKSAPMPEYEPKAEPVPLEPAASSSSDKENTIAEASGESAVDPPAPSAPSADPAASADAPRFTSAFRGRTIHGLSVPLPAGYAGLVLQAPPSTQPAPAPKRKTRRRNAPTEVEDEDGEADEDELPARTLRPTARFDDLVLWNPDIPPDAGQDAYVRSMTEWMALAAEIHRIE